MNYSIHYLPSAGYDDDGNPKPAREMDNRIALDDYSPSDEDVEEVWVHAVDGEIDADSPEEALNALWPLYNRGSGQARLAEMDEAEMPSLSVNDVVYLNGEGYICERMGWGEL